jgi:hypothetical protein
MALRYLLITVSVLAVWLIAVFAVQRFINREVSNLKIVDLEINGIKIEAELADNFLSRAQGLSGRKSLDENKGMLFVFGNLATRSFWMKDMNFPIDIIWINGDKVAGFAENAPIPANPPAGGGIPSFKSPERVDKVLELPAGSVQKIGIKAGDEIKYKQ